MKILFITFILSIPGIPHHFKGLPHFSYFENYPQTPQEEFLGQAGDYEVSVVLYDFQGLEKQEMSQPDDARLFLIIFELMKNKVYSGPVKMDILDKGTSIYTENQSGPQEENVYNIHHRLPQSGQYTLQLELLDENNLTILVPFKLSSQKVAWGRWVAGFLFILIFVSATGARRARVRKDRQTATFSKESI